MKKSPANKKDKGNKTYVVSGSRSSKEGKTTKIYRKDGSIKSERNIKDSGTKKETRYSASPRTLKRSKKQVDVKDAATRSYTKYKKDGTVKKSITKKDAENTRGTGVDRKVDRKINRKTRRDMKGAKNMTYKQDQRKDVDVKRKPVASSIKSPAKKPLVGGQKRLPKELQEAIIKAPAKMLTKSAIKMMDKSPMNMKTPMKKSKQRVEQDYARNAIADYKSGKTKEAKYEKKKALEVAAGESPAKLKKPSKKKKTYSSSKIDPNYHNQASKTVSTQGGARYGEGKTKTKFVDSDSPYHDRNYKSRESLTKTKTVNKGYGQFGRSTTKETQKSISPKRADRMRSRFRKGLEKQSPSMMKTNQDGGGYAAKNMAAPARQLKKLGSILSKHMKSN